MRKTRLSSLLALLLLSPLTRLYAHPMGNFSINHYAQINASVTAVSVHAVLDYAEIPAFQLFSNWGIRSDVEMSAAELQPMVEGLVAELKPQFRLLINGSETTLQLSNIQHETTAGAGGPFTLRGSFEFCAPLQTAPARLEFFPDNYPARIWWLNTDFAPNPSVELPGGN